MPLSLSQCTITLNSSKTYLRLSALLYALTAYALICSQISGWIQFIACLFLSAQLIKIIRNPLPLPKILEISFQDEQWKVHTRDDPILVFEKHKVLLEAGILFILELSNAEKRQLFIIFFDQINAETYQSLRLIETIN